jgi:hypothetical protein
MDWATEEMDYEWENGAPPCTVMEKEGHESIIDVAITLGGIVAGVVNSEVMGRWQMEPKLATTQCDLR